MKALLDILSLIIAIVGTILTSADTQATISGISPELAAKWPIILGVAMIISQIARLIGDKLDDGIINNSFKVFIVCLGLASLMFVMTGCNITLPKVETKFCYYNEDGELCVGSTANGNVAVTGGFRSEKPE